MIKELLSSKYLKYILIAFLIYMPIFGNLGELPIRIWDESRLAINAIEMLNNGNFLVTYFDNQPDLWNTNYNLELIAKNGSINKYKVISKK